MKLQDAVMRMRLLEAGMLDWNADVEGNRRALAAVLDEMQRLAGFAQTIASTRRDLSERCVSGSGPVDAISATVERVLRRYSDTPVSPIEGMLRRISVDLIRAEFAKENGSSDYAGVTRAESV